MKIQILDKTKKKRFLEGVSELGLKKMRHLLIMTGKERVRAFSGDLSNEEIMTFWKLFNIEGIGLYIGKEQIDRKNGRREVRLSLDGLHLLKDQISGNIIDLNEEQEEKWFSGEDIDFSKCGKIKERGFVAVRSEKTKDFIGTGKISADGTMLFSYLPKERQRKN